MSKRRPNRVRSAENLEPRCMLTGWGLDAIDAPEVWNHGFEGQGVTVAVIDSGIDIHADLLPNVWVNKAEKINGRDDDGNGYVDDLNGWNFVDNDNKPIGTHNHGTHVSGTIAADQNDFGTTGVAHRAKIMPLRAFDEAGKGSTSDIADAVRYAVRNGADVINLSIGSTATRSLTLALEYAAKQNVLVVAASGNDGASAPVFPAIQSAEWPHVISVGAHDQRFESIDTSNQVGSSKAIQVDAPGTSILSTITKNEFGRKGGTSSAAAHVAGIAALMISANDNLTAAELRNAIVASASKRVVGSDSVGAVNALRAVALVAGGFTGSTFEIAQEADFDNDGEVGLGDFLTLARNYGSQNESHRTGDADGDGEVGFSDFLLLAKNYGDDIPANFSRELADLQSAIAQSPAETTDTSSTRRRPTASSSPTTPPTNTTPPLTPTVAAPAVKPVSTPPVAETSVTVNKTSKNRPSEPVVVRPPAPTQTPAPTAPIVPKQAESEATSTDNSEATDLAIIQVVDEPVRWTASSLLSLFSSRG